MLGSLISAGTSIIGGLFGRSNARKEAQREYERQKEFAQHGISWRAEDAKRAGISKYYALGANTASYAPSSVGGSDYGISSAGQSLGRAIDATAGGKQRLGRQLLETQLDGARIDNEIKRTELASRRRLANQPGTPPAYPDGETIPAVPGQGNAPEIKVQKRLAPAGHVPQKSFGVNPEVDMYRTTKGYTPMVPPDLGESMDAQPMSAWQWYLRNNLAPGLFGQSHYTPPYKAPKGKHWRFNLMRGEYTLHDNPDNTYRLRIPRVKGRRR